MLDLLRNVLPAYALLILTAILLIALYGAAAFWASAGRAGWLLRIAPIALLLAALAPLGAYELMIAFGTQFLVIVAWVAWIRIALQYRLGRERGESRRTAWRAAIMRTWGEGPRFQLRDLFKAVLLAACVLAIVRFAAPPFSALGGSIPWGPMTLVGLIFGALSVAAAWVIFGRARRLYRASAMLLLAALAGISQFAAGVNFLLVITICVALVALMALARMTEWSYLRREPNAAERAAAEAAPSRVWRRFLSRVAVCTVALVGLSILVSIYRMLLPPARPEVVLLEPNGYDELVKIGGSVNWSAIPRQDVEGASAGASQTFVASNMAELAATREALAMPSHVPVDYGPQGIGTAMADVQALRSLARALAAEAKLAESQDRHADAVAIYLNLVQLGDATSHGGLMIHELVGIAIRGMGLQGMAPELSQLDSAELAIVCERLAASIDSRETLEEVLERDKTHGMLTHGWPYLALWLAPELLNPAYEAAAEARRRDEAHLNLLLAEVAVRRHTLEHGAPPDSLAALVPEYLARVPRDAYGDGPLVYRRTPDGHLLYSIGANGTDEGGQRVPFIEAVVDRHGDLFYDADPNEPATVEVAAESSSE